MTPLESDPSTTAENIPATLTHPRAGAFWLSVLLTGAGAGLAAIALTLILQAVQHWTWPSSVDATLLDGARAATPYRHVLVLLAAGALTGLGQLLLTRLTSGNGIDITEAISFSAGRVPKLRTLGSALLSVIVVGMGASLGREGAPKQAAAVVANVLSDRVKLSDEQRRLLVACAAGAGMAAAYGVPLGGALFAIEVMRGALALRMVLPALVASLVATAVSFLALPDAPTYAIPAFPDSAAAACFALVIGPIAGIVSVGYVRLIALADRQKPRGYLRIVTPALALGTLGILSIRFPELLGNGKDVAELTFLGAVPPMLLVALLLLKPAATAACLASGTPGGLFTPSLALGALLGALFGHAWSAFWPGVPPGLFAVIGAAAVLAATTQGPLSATVLLMELTGHSRAFIVPVLLAVGTATLVARTIEPRSIYDARLTDAQVRERRRLPALSG